MKGVVALINLGCPKNRVDGERLLADYAQKGWTIGSMENADLVIVNTCSFIAPAVEESMNQIEALYHSSSEKPKRRLVVTGCLVQRDRQLLRESFPGLHSFHDLSDVRRLEEAKAPRLVTTFPFAFLKIAEGCSRSCSFCLIPSLRGPFRSLSEDWVLQEAAALRRIGIQEIVLVAQDAARWGADLYGQPRFLHLAERIAECGFPWLRLLYLHPQMITASFLRDLKAIGNVVPYLDIPLQHVSSRILKLMRRPGGEAQVRKAVELVRSNWPEAALRTSLIVGFPSETEAEFESLLDFARQVHFERMAIFPYYAEEGTAAAAFPGQLPTAIKNSRYEALWSLQQNIYREANEQLVGKKLLVLADGPDPEEEGVLLCRSTRDAPEIDAQVRVRSAAGAGDFLTVGIVKALEYDLIGETDKEA